MIIFSSDYFFQTDMYGYDEYGNMGGYNPSMGMGVGMMNAPTIINGVYMFTGQATAFQIRAGQVNTSTEAPSIKDAALNMTGTQISDFGTCCFICTLVWGSIIIIPLFFMCCDWWKRMVYPTYNVPYSSYGAIENLLRLPNLQNLTLSVNDNGLDQQKINLLYDLVSRSQLRSFTFINNAGMLDLTGANEYSQFFTRMKIFKKLNIVTDIRWGYEIVH